MTIAPKALFVPLLASIAGCGTSHDSGRDRLPPPVRTTLEAAPTLELLSLHPMHESAAAEPPAHRSKLHGYPVLGRTTLSGAAKRDLLGALYAGIGASDGRIAGCFNPRHGIVARADDVTVELVICFECFSMHAHRDGEAQQTILTDRSPRAEFNRVLRAASVPLAGD